MDRVEKKMTITAQEKMEMDIIAEGELARLQRQYRTMEFDRMQLRDVTNVHLTKQRKTIRSLEREHDRLCTDLKIAASKSNKKKDRAMTATFSNIMHSYESYDARLQKAKLHLQELNDEIFKIERQSTALRSNVQQQEEEESVIDSRSKIEAFEDRVDTAVKRLCFVSAQNKRIREEIERLFKERKRFNEMWAKAILRSSEKKRSAFASIEQATAAYDRREEYCSKLAALRSRDCNDHLIYSQEMKEIKRQLDHTIKLEEFLQMKSRRRLMRDLEEMERTRDKIRRGEVRDRSESYRCMLQTIRRVAGEDEESKLALRFAKREEENFALFNYINELHHEIESLGENVRLLQRGIVDQQAVNREVAAKGKSSADCLKSELEVIVAKERLANEKLEERQLDFAKLLHEIENLLHISTVERWSDTPVPILHLFGTRESDIKQLDRNNIVLYLGVLHRNVLRLLSHGDDRAVVHNGFET